MPADADACCGSCVNLLVPPDDVLFLRTAHEIYRKHDRYSEAMTIALRLGDRALIRADFEAPTNPLMRKLGEMRMAYDESENPVVERLRSITDTIGGWFQENETARVVAAAHPELLVELEQGWCCAGHADWIRRNGRCPWCCCRFLLVNTHRLIE